MWGFTSVALQTRLNVPQEREGYATDAITKKRNPNAKKIGRSPAKKVGDSPYMPCYRSSPYASPSYTGLAPDPQEESFIRALKQSPASTGEPVLDNILGKMRDFYNVPTPTDNTERFGKTAK